MPNTDDATETLLAACVNVSHAWRILGKRCAVVIEIDGVERIIAPDDPANIARMLYAAADAVADRAMPPVPTKQ